MAIGLTKLSTGDMKAVNKGIGVSVRTCYLAYCGTTHRQGWHSIRTIRTVCIPFDGKRALGVTEVCVCVCVCVQVENLHYLNDGLWKLQKVD